MATHSEDLLEKETLIDNRELNGASGLDEAFTISNSAEDYDWLGGLTATGPAQRDAIRRLHELMVRAAKFKLSRMGEASRLGQARADVIVQSSADEAVVAILKRLPSFEGRSRFTTWAYKFGILHTATAVRREVWLNTEIDLSSIPEPTSRLGDPVAHMEGLALSEALRRCIMQCLTPHQQRILIAITVEGVPIDVIADRLHTTRNTVYKTLHEARRRLREGLIAQGYITTTEEVN
ncbi:MAG: sigma-70 family RNA polymerase sigma factor [Microbacteriaceae bacterium]|nr:sigma-70 family RNA polymerase sigma factor [Microbacteriaceae bacterium]